MWWNASSHKEHTCLASKCSNCLFSAPFWAQLSLPSTEMLPPCFVKCDACAITQKCIIDGYAMSLTQAFYVDSKTQLQIAGVHPQGLLVVPDLVGARACWVAFLHCSSTATSVCSPFDSSTPIMGLSALGSIRRAHASFWSMTNHPGRSEHAENKINTACNSSNEATHAHSTRLRWQNDVNAYTWGPNACILVKPSMGIYIYIYIWIAHITWVCRDVCKPKSMMVSK